MRPVTLDATVRWGSTILTVAEPHLGQDDVGSRVEGVGIPLMTVIAAVMGPRTALLTRAATLQPPPDSDYATTRVTIGAP